VPIDKKIEHLLRATEPMRGDARIHQVSGEISCYRQEKLFASTVGSFIEQTTTQMGGGIEAVAIHGDDFQRRTYPNPFGGDFQAEGWEFIERLDMPATALKIRDQPSGKPRRHLGTCFDEKIDIAVRPRFSARNRS
jgi:TldD protein